MYLPERGRIERIGELADRAIDQRLLPGGHDQSALVVRLEVADVVHRGEAQVLALRRRYPADVIARRPDAVREGPAAVLETRRRGVDALAQALDRVGEPRRVDRLHDVVDRTLFERGNGVLVVGGD